MFITFEGLDLCGKSTQARLLVASLESRPLPGELSARPVRLIREPGGTAISERLRSILLDRKNLELHQTTELMLFSASRAQLVAEVIGPALQRGETVVCDRYCDSTTAYQGYGRGLDLLAVRQINAIATAGVNPDLTLFIDIDIDEIARRRQLSGIPTDRMESFGAGFYRDVRRGYLEIVETEPHRVVRIDGMEPVEVVERKIWKALESKRSNTRSKS